jgi:hypothetical protein
VDQTIRVPIGNSTLEVDFGLFCDIHEQVATEMKARGLRGLQLDIAIAAALPAAVLRAVSGAPVGTMHWVCKSQPRCVFSRSIATRAPGGSELKNLVATGNRRSQ